MSGSDPEEGSNQSFKKKKKTSPVKLTWRGVAIYFPQVVLTKDLKEKADEALNKLMEERDAVLPSLGSSGTWKKSETPVIKEEKDSLHSNEEDETDQVHGQDSRRKTDISDAVTRGSQIFCPGCSIGFQRWTAYEEHYRSTHDDSPKQEDEDEQEVCANDEPPATSESPSVAEEEVECDKCKRKFAKIRFLRIHLKRGSCRSVIQQQMNHHNSHPIDTEGETPCPFCSVLFTKRSNCFRHMRLHKCPHCGKDFDAILAKVEHEQACKKISKMSVLKGSDVFFTFSCPICQARSSAKELITHMAIHSSETVSPTKADESPCSSSVKQSSSKNGDLYSPSVPPGPNLFTCKFRGCAHFFSHKEDLFYHIEKKHKQKGSLCCSHSGQDFGSEDLVNEHVKQEHAGAACPASPSKPTSVPSTKTVAVKQEDESDDSNFEDLFPEQDDDEDDDVPRPRPHSSAEKTDSIMPKVRIKIEGDDFIVPPHLNPVVVISAGCKSRAEDSLWKLTAIQNYESITPYKDYYVCQECLERPTFDEREEYVFHMVEHDDDRRNRGRPAVEKFTCQVCRSVDVDKTFTSRTSYRQHLTYHRKTGRAILRQVTAKFDTEEGRPLVGLEYSCDICNDGRKFKQRVAYIMHLRRHERQKAETGQEAPLRAQPTKVPIQDEYVCEICDGKKFGTRTSYVFHLRNHRRQKALTGFVAPLNPIDSRKSEIPIQDEYTCELCSGKKNSDRTSYLKHISYHQKRKTVSVADSLDIPIQEEYTCTDCGDKTFTSRKIFLSHLNYHEKMKRIREQKEKRSQLTRPDIPIQETYSCETCNGRTFTNRLAYIGHMGYHQKLQSKGEDRPIGIQAETKTRMRKDIPIQDVYVCDTCHGREFRNRGSYVTHVNYHQTLQKRGMDRPIGEARLDIPLQDEYTCDLCEDKKTFTDREEFISHLSCHKRLHHKTFHRFRDKFKPTRWTDSIPLQDTYVCETCPSRTFASRASYISHLMYHKLLEKRGCNHSIPSRKLYHQERQRKMNEIPDQEFYTCEKCNHARTYLNRQSYVAHLMYHQRIESMGRSVGKPRERCVYKCVICENREFTSKSLYTSHVRYHEKIRETEGQDRPTRTKEELGEWRRQKSKEKPGHIPDQKSYPCAICSDGRTYRTKLLYLAHISYHEKVKQREGQHRPVRLLGERVRVPTPTEPLKRRKREYACDLCNGRVLKNGNSYRSHMHYHYKTGRIGPLKQRPLQTPRNDIPIQDEYTCTRCEKPRKYTDRQAYKTHLAYHEMRDKQGLLSGNGAGRKALPPPLRSYRCHLCPTPRFFSKRSLFTGHLQYHKMKDSNDAALSDINNVHPNVVADIKDQMNTAFASTGVTPRFNLDEKQSTSSSEKKYKCSMCDRAYDNPWFLDRHESLHRAEALSGSCICSDCGMRFSNNFSVLRHQQNSCKKVPCKYTCHCGDKFHSVDSLEKHVNKMHANQPPQPSRLYRCYVCKTEFQLPTELDDHVRETHPVDYEEFMQFRAKLHEGREQEEDMDDESEPIYPEVVMTEADHNDIDPLAIQETTEVEGSSCEANTTVDSSENPVTEAGGWNFIPMLAANNDSEDEDDSADVKTAPYLSSQFPFEPEEVYIPPGLSITSTLADDSSQSSDSRPSRQSSLDTDDVDGDWRPQSSTTVGGSAPPTKKRRTFTDDAVFKCGYCFKSSHRLAYIRSHFKMHKGLPFKCINLITREEYDDLTPLKKKRPPAPTRTLPPVATILISRSTTAPVIATVSPLTQSYSQVAPTVAVAGTSGIGLATQLTESVKQALSSVVRQRTKAKCSCVTEDTALGYQKRCTGDTCGCYTHHKGCSDECDCKRFCGNPWVRPRVPAILPGLIPIHGDGAPVSQDSTQRRTLRDFMDSVIEGALGGTGSASTSTSTATVGSVQPYLQQSSQQVETDRFPQQVSSTVVTIPTLSTLGSNPGLATSSYRPSPPPYQTVASIPPTPSSMPVSVVNPQGSFPRGMNIQTHPNPSDKVPTTTTLPPQKQYPAIRPYPITTNQLQLPTSASMYSAETTKIYRCFCSQLYTSLMAFLRHQWTHKEEKLFLCPICREQFTHVGRLIVHSDKHPESKTDNLAMCFVCDLVTENKEELQKHVHLIHPEVVCATCKKCFVTEAELALHRVQAHQLRCYICRAAFMSHMVLQSHVIRDHHNQTETQQGSIQDQSPSMDKPVQVVTILDEIEESLQSRTPSPDAPVIVSVTGNDSFQPQPQPQQIQNNFGTL